MTRYRYAVLMLLAFALPGCATWRNMTKSEKWSIGLAAVDVGLNAYAAHKSGPGELEPTFLGVPGVSDNNGLSDEEIILSSFLMNVLLQWALHEIFDDYERDKQEQAFNMTIAVRSPLIIWNVTAIRKTGRIDAVPITSEAP